MSDRAAGETLTARAAPAAAVIKSTVRVGRIPP